MTAAIEKTPVEESSIVMFWHCRHCLKEVPADMSAKDYQSIEAGWTKIGMQVWCKRHHTNVAHINFEGQKHLADFTDTGDLHERQTKNTGAEG